MCARIRISYMDSVTLRLRVVGVCLRAADTHTASGIQFYSSSFFTADHRSRSLAGCKCDRFGNAIRYTSRGRPHVVPLHSHGVRLCSAHTDTVPVVAIRICMAYIHIYAVRLWPRWLHSITVAWSIFSCVPTGTVITSLCCGPFVLCLSVLSSTIDVNFFVYFVVTILPNAFLHSQLFSTGSSLRESLVSSVTTNIKL